MKPIYPLLLLCAVLTSCKPDSSNPYEVFYGLVSSATPEATQAGYDILLAGGNAADAAIAVSFVLAVTEPAMSGLGGGTQVLLALPHTRPVAINGSTVSPAATPVNATEDSLTYHRRSTIPSTVKTLDFLLKNYGSGKLTWEQLLQPAIHYAERGFVVGMFRHKVYKKYHNALRNSPYGGQLFLLSDGQIPAPVDTLKQPVLANTLKRLAQNGADDFYKGEIARQIATDMTANSGWISLDDLQNFSEPEVLAPLFTTYRGYTVFSQPPPCGGWATLLILNLLEKELPENLAPGTQSRFEKVLKALHIAHQHRKEAPVEDMVNYETFTSKKLSKDFAAQLALDFKTPSRQEEEVSGETTHFSVVDKDGMALAVTASINAYFGAAAASPKLGFLYNSYMDDFELGQPDHPFAIGPGKMAYSSMSPTIVQRDTQTVLVIGSPGSARIISSVAQLTQLWIDSDLGIEKIVAQPRLHTNNGRFYVENPESIPLPWIEAQRQMGFELAFPTYDLINKHWNPYFGGVHAIAWETGHWNGVADPRRDGTTYFTTSDD